jgi:DNA segregation ATPase FtsK/SpoIIIE, S-DNA-T family
MKKKRSTFDSEVRGILTLAGALLLAVSLVSFAGTSNFLGLFGQIVGGSFTYLFGVGSYFIVLFALLAGGSLVLRKEWENYRRSTLLFALFLLPLCLMLTALADLLPGLGAALERLTVPQLIDRLSPITYREIRFPLGGVPLYWLYRDVPAINLYQLLSPGGTLLITGTGMLAILLTLTKVSLFQLAQRLKPKPREKRPKPEPLFTQLEKVREEEPIIEEAPPPPPPPPPRPKRNAPTNLKNYRVPAINLLTPVNKVDLSGLKASLKAQAEVLEETLGSFGIDAKVVDVNCGPTIASFEVQPAIGVKVQKITALASDIALNMQARSIRILAPIPGKAVVGIEVPSPVPQAVGFRESLASYQRSSKQLQIPIFLGKSVSGEEVVADLTKMPHCIIAGATGSGKSVCVNTIIMSIIMTARPDEVRLLMIDPKKVELTPYTYLPHMIAPVITEPKEACVALGWLVQEMERRYEMFKAVGVRHIGSFNGRERIVEEEEALDFEVPERLPYIVGVIDELADLMMASSSDIETPITRIAQMARAVGIHLIIATQRPSREVITGLIKANFPTRIAFKVASRVNSQIILDDTGAETLLGNGDLLFLPPGTSALVRAQGTYVRDEDIRRVVENVCSQAAPDYLIESFTGPDPFDEPAPGERDDLYDKALSLVRVSGVASTTYIQRKLKIGYARAASIMDRFEEEGIVGPQEGSKPRKVLA